MTTTEHPRFTETTWADVTSTGYLSYRDRERASYWMKQHDLAVEMAEGGIGVELARLLISATLSGMPIVVKWRGGDSVFTETIMIRDLGMAHEGGGLMHVSKWGGGHPLYYSQIIEAGTPEAVFEFEAHGKRHTITHPAFGEEQQHTVEACEAT